MAMSKRRFYSTKRDNNVMRGANNTPIETTFPTPMMPFADNDVGEVTQTEAQRMTDSRSPGQQNDGTVLARRSFEGSSTRPWAKYTTGPNGQVKNDLEDERTKITKSGGFSGRL
jgi:hypothetical protein